MKKLLTSNKGILLLYSLIVLGIASLCLFLLFAGIYEVSAVLGISGATTFVVLVIMLYGNVKRNEDNVVKPGSFIALSILRFLFLAAGVVLSAVMLYFTNAGADKYRLFYSIISIIPIGISIVLYTVRSKSE